MNGILKLCPQLLWLQSSTLKKKCLLHWNPEAELLLFPEMQGKDNKPWCDDWFSDFFFFRLLFLLYIYVCVYIQREREHIWYIKYILYIQIDINSNIWGIYSYLLPSLDVFSLALMNKSYFPATWMQKHCKAHFGFYCIILKEKIKFIIFNCESTCLYIIFYQHSIWELKF